MHRGGKVDDDRIWGHCHKTLNNVQDSDVWLFPIHCAGNHWTLAIVYWRKRRIAYFDSLGSKTVFEADSMVR